MNFHQREGNRSERQLGPERHRDLQVVVGNPKRKDTKNMFDALRNRFVPNKVVLFKPTNEESTEIARLAEFTRYMSCIDSKATAYICKDRACELPMAYVEKALKIFDGTS